MGHLRCLLGNTSPQGLGKFYVGTGDAHGLLAEAAKRAEQGMKRIKIITDKFGAEIYFLPHLRLGRNHHHSANKDYQPRTQQDCRNQPTMQPPSHTTRWRPSPAGQAIAAGAPWESSGSPKPQGRTIYILLISDISLWGDRSILRNWTALLSR